jgi:phenylalanine ammonia-lyase
VDLRTLHRTFIADLEEPARQLIAGLFPDTHDLVRKERFFTTFWKKFEAAWYDAALYDAPERSHKAAQSLVIAVFSNTQQIPTIVSVETVTILAKSFETLILESYLRHRDEFFQKQTTPEYLGQGTKAIYLFVREKLGVPLHRGLVEHPVAGDKQGNVIDGRPKRTIGSWVSIIYEAVRDGSLYAEVFRFLEVSGGLSVAGGIHGIKAANGLAGNGTH